MFPGPFIPLQSTCSTGQCRAVQQLFEGTSVCQGHKFRLCGTPRVHDSVLTGSWAGGGVAMTDKGKHTY